MIIKKAQLADLPDLVPLFDGYRMFYRQTSNFVGAREFLRERIKNDESQIFMVYIEENAVAFVQFYPLFSSVSMEPMLLLNDLYVEENYRGQGIGRALIDKGKAICRENNLKGLALQTEVDNPAQKLYEAVGFIKDPDLHYFWKNS